MLNWIDRLRHKSVETPLRGKSDVLCIVVGQVKVYVWPKLNHKFLQTIRQQLLQQCLNVLFLFFQLVNSIGVHCTCNLFDDNFL